MRALAYAASLQQPVLAVHVSPTDEEGERFRGYWSTWGDHLPLEVVVSPYRAIVAPMVNYIESLHRLQPGPDADRDPAGDRRAVTAGSASCTTGTPPRLRRALRPPAQDRRHHRAVPAPGLSGHPHGIRS